jgi:hypothetical protein
MMTQATERAACKVCGAFYCPTHLLGGDDKQQVVRKALTEVDALADKMERALSQLVDKIMPGLDTGDILADARTASTALDARKD